MDHAALVDMVERKGSLPFLMYPNGENDAGSFDELAPDAFKYTISAKEIV